MPTPTLILFGRPGSGKGTLSQHLTDAFGYRACSTGQAMRAWASGDAPEQMALRATMAAGEYGSDELAVRIVRDFIGSLPDGVTGVILDGFPRDLAQLDAWFDTGADPGTAVVVDTPVEVCRQRALGRMVCASCGWTDRQPATSCSRCHAVLQRRIDDEDQAAFSRRLRDYDSRVAPIIDAWSSAGLPLYRIDASLDMVGLARGVHGLLTGVTAAPPASKGPRHEPVTSVIAR